MDCQVLSQNYIETLTHFLFFSSWYLIKVSPSISILISDSKRVYSEYRKNKDKKKGPMLGKHKCCKPCSVIHRKICMSHLYFTIEVILSLLSNHTNCKNLIHGFRAYRWSKNIEIWLCENIVQMTIPPSKFSFQSIPSHNAKIQRNSAFWFRR